MNDRDSRSVGAIGSTIHLRCEVESVDVLGELLALLGELEGVQEVVDETTVRGLWMDWHWYAICTILTAGTGELARKELPGPRRRRPQPTEGQAGVLVCGIMAS